MSLTKKGLDPLVECSECPESQENQDSPDPEVPGDQNNRHGMPHFRATDGDSAGSRGKEASKRKKSGSRVSLASLFSFSSATSHNKGDTRERSRSGWSYYGDDSSVVMSSVSASDLRTSNPTCTSNNKRYRGSDTGCSQNEEASEMLLGAESEREEEEERKKGRKATRECPLCCNRSSNTLYNFPKLVNCSHRSCRPCIVKYVELAIMENRIEVSCPECSNHIHPNDIRKLVGSKPGLVEKYEEFSVRRFLLTEPDARWCPAPDCGFAVIASSCAACPQLKCSRDSCGMLFCYHCKEKESRNSKTKSLKASILPDGSWHANQTCDEARRSRAAAAAPIPSGSKSSRRITASSIPVDVLKPGDIKACPRCRTYIVKMDDGSCNHMVCAMCSVEFCWLCLKEISDLHYLSPTGCTFWGKKPWTRKKKLLWQIGTLIGAPVGIALIAGLSIPGIIIGVPFLVGRKVHQGFRHHSPTKRRAVTAACVAGSVIVSPVLAFLAVGVGVPIMLAYVYGVVPLSLCRNGGCGLSGSSSDSDENIANDVEIWRDTSDLDRSPSQLVSDIERHVDGTSIAPGLSIQSGSISTNHVRLTFDVANPKRARSPSISSGGSDRLSPEARCNYEEASTKGMAGSHYHYIYDDKSVHTVYSGHEVVSYCEDVASTKALAGSVHDSKSLCESVCRHPGKHENGCDDGQGHSYACATPSTSSVEHSKLHAEEGPSRRKLESRSRTLSVVATVHASPDPETNVDVDIEAQQPCSSRTMHLDSRDEADPFKIRTLLDNMKQMVAADVPPEKPYEPSTLSSANRLHGAGRFRRSGSGRSLTTVGTHNSIGESQPLRSNSNIPAAGKEKRSFLASLFRRNRK